MSWIFWIFLIFLISFAYSASKGAPWVPTWKKDLYRIFELADFKEGDVFFELGAGNARVCRAMNKMANEKKITCIGIELSLFQQILARVQNLCSNNRNVQMVMKNAFDVSLDKADVIYVFLMPDVYQKLKIKIEKECKSGTRIITYAWPIDDWKPHVVSKGDGLTSIYCYLL